MSPSTAFPILFGLFRLKLYCVTHDIVLMHFVVEAIEEKLGRKTRLKKGPA